MAFNDIAIRINAYEQTIKTLGNEKVKGQPLIRELATGRTKQEAFEVARKPLLAKYESYATWGQTDTKKSARFQILSKNFVGTVLLLVMNKKLLMKY